jgi:hypothetical protein
MKIIERKGSGALFQNLWVGEQPRLETLRLYETMALNITGVA